MLGIGNGILLALQGMKSYAETVIGNWPFLLCLISSIFVNNQL